MINKDKSYRIWWILYSIELVTFTVASSVHHATATVLVHLLTLGPMSKNNTLFARRANSIGANVWSQPSIFIAKTSY